MRFKIFIIFSAIFSLFLFSPVSAADYGLGATIKATGGSLPTSIKGASSLPELAGLIVNVVLSLVGILFFILMLYAGITWMKSFGNSEDVNKAKDMITQAIIGLVIVMAAYAISNFVFTSLGAGGGSGGAGGGGAGGGTGSGPVTHEDGAPCTIDNESWSDGTIKLTGESGRWNCGPGVKNCKDSGECQPSCRFKNAGAKCQKADCPGKVATTAGSTCPSAGICCLP